MYIYFTCIKYHYTLINKISYKWSYVQCTICFYNSKIDGNFNETTSLENVKVPMCIHICNYSHNCRP